MVCFCSRMFTHNLACYSPAVNILCTSTLFDCFWWWDHLCFPVCFLSQHLFGRVTLSADVEPGVMFTYFSLCGYILSSPVCWNVNMVPCCSPVPPHTWEKKEHQQSSSGNARPARFFRGQGICFSTTLKGRYYRKQEKQNLWFVTGFACFLATVS